MDVFKADMRKPTTKRHKPKTAAGRLASREREYQNAVADWNERSLQERLAWLAKPKLHTAIFKTIFFTEQIEKYARGNCSREERREQKLKIREITQKFGWARQRFDQFTSLALAYRKEPSTEHYWQSGPNSRNWTSRLDSPGERIPSVLLKTNSANTASTPPW